jgi:hypothetical protein
VKKLTHVCAALMLATVLAAAGKPQSPTAPKNLPAGANLFIQPMEWNLDEYIHREVRKSRLPVHLVQRPEEADFIMTGSSVKLGSRMISPSRDFEVQLSEAGSGALVWSTEASDYAIFFSRLRSHGAGRAAKSIVNKMRSRFFPSAR